MRENSTSSLQADSGSQQPPAGSSLEPTPLPYRPSWVNRLIGWIDRLPFPPWVFYTLLLIVQTVVLLASNWIEGTAPVGSFATPFIFTWTAFYPVAFLATIHHVDGIALRSFEAFLPALGVSDAEAARLRYELTTLPARPAWIAALLGAASFGFVIFLESNKEFSRTFPLTFNLTLFVGTMGFVMSAAMLYHTFHQLRLVNHIHSIAAAVDLHNPLPLYAFSNLSARTGLIFLLVLWFDLVFNPVTLTNLGLFWINVIGIGLFAVACFILPLLGMHRRLVREKQRLQLEANQRIKASFEQLYQRVDGADLHDADLLNKSINSLIAAHDFISRTPTWPWKPETFYFFFSAVTIPIIVFVIQLLIKNLLGFE